MEQTLPPTLHYTSVGQASCEQKRHELEAAIAQYLLDFREGIKSNLATPRSDFRSRVELLVRIHDNGTVSNIRITLSSGSSFHDKAAVNAVVSACPLTPLPKGSPYFLDVQYLFEIGNHPRAQEKDMQTITRIFPPPQKNARYAKA